MPSKAEHFSMTSIKGFDPKYLPDFISLNRQWIEKYFVLEPMDLMQLENPYETILNPGGEILFLLQDDQVVGTVALIPHGPGCYEIAKMAVLPTTRGKGYGDILMKAAKSWATSKSARKLMLLSNTILNPAISLYQKHGFKTLRQGEHPDYKRCNIEMELQL
jgi:N-acetylglutamate synthase-like GNAT family acetyltransferase